MFTDCNSVADFADSIRYDPNALDTEGNAYWYFEGSSGVLYKEEPPKPGRKAKPPLWQPICRGHEVYIHSKEPYAFIQKSPIHSLSRAICNNMP